MKSFLPLLLVILTGCVTAHPEQVPALRGEVLPALTIPSLKPQTVNFSVKNTRAVNTQFGNAAQVEAAVKAAFVQSIYRGGLTTNEKSPNTLTLTIEDCPATSDANLECVSLELKLKTKRYHLAVSGRMANGMQRSGESIPGMGDISKSYQDASAMVLDDLPRQVKKSLEENSLQ